MRPAACRRLLAFKPHHQLATTYRPTGTFAQSLPLLRAICTRAQSQEQGKGYGNFVTAGLLATAGLVVSASYPQRVPELEAKAPEGSDETLVNWSSTHECHPKAVHQPETLRELEKLVAQAHKQGKKLRPIGSALSPNGLAFTDDELVNLAGMDKVLDVDVKKKQVTVQAGARVAQVTAALREHGLALQNFASIAEQQIGGFTQVGAHGTGATLPSVDEQVVGLKLVTPGRGTVKLGAAQDPATFALAKVGLGALGVVAEATLQCVPAHRLVEHTWVATRAEVIESHDRLLRENKHIRFMWLPYTDKVVVVACNPLRPDQDEAMEVASIEAQPAELKLAHLRNLLLMQGTPLAFVAPYLPDALMASPALFDSLASLAGAERRAAVEDMNFAQLRDELVAAAPLSLPHIRSVNRAEADFWMLNAGKRVDWSDRILGFECGGEQWVCEVAFPVGTLESLSGADMNYMQELLEVLETAAVPAPCPIEQRWTASSSSAMSLASAPPSAPPDTVHSWVGIIMYLPTQDAEQRHAITEQFMAYRALARQQLWDKYGATEHWAKVEMPVNEEEKQALQTSLAKRFPVDAFNAARMKFDPKNILANDLVNVLFASR